MLQAGEAEPRHSGNNPADCVTEHLMGMLMMDVKQAKQIRNQWLEETMG